MLTFSFVNSLAAMRSFLTLVLLCLLAVAPVSGQNNPLLEKWTTPFEVPPFQSIRPEHFMPAFRVAIEEHRKEIDGIANNPKPATFENTIDALDRAGMLNERIGGVFGNLTLSDMNDTLQQIAMEVTPLQSALEDDILMNEKLFNRVQVVFVQRNNLRLNPEQKRLVEETWKGFVRGGANLKPEQKARMRQINEEMSLLELQFAQNVLKETNAFRLGIENQADLAGLPPNVVSAAAEAAKVAGQDGKWVFTLQAPSYGPFMQYAENRDLRRKMFEASLARANQDNANDNKRIAARLAALRVEKAQLLGHKTWANYVLQQRMAKTPENVYKLLDQVWKPATVAARREAADLQEMIRKDGKDFKLEPWDWAYYAEKLKKERYNLDEAEVQQYFALDNVRKGVFYVANKLYGITIAERKDIPVYHPEVKAYEVKDRDGKHLGIFFADYHPRAGKRSGAWSNSYRGQRYVGGTSIRPIVVNVANFTRPTGEQPALLRPGEVETLFHEFGHALHKLLGNVHYGSLGGVPRDFVELPSQIMEHWAFEPEVLKMYARHWKTGELLPVELQQKIEASNKFNQGFMTTSYMAAAYLDMDWHMLTDTTLQDVRAFEKASAEKMGLMPEIGMRYPTTMFQHIFVNTYYAGYYSYLWSEVLDADAFEAFKEKGLFDQSTALSFRKNVLEKGGTADPMEMYINFRGREPSVEPLLKNRGLDGSTVAAGSH